MERLPSVSTLLRGWVGRTIATVSGAPNRVLGVETSDVVVGTDRSPEGQRVPLSMVEPALELLARDGEVEISVDAIGHRSAFCGAMLLTIPGVVRLGGSPPRVGWRPTRAVAAPSPEDRGAIRPWWTGHASESLWMEITDRNDIGTDLHCPQRDTSDRANPGYSTILFVGDGDIVVHYDRMKQAVTALSIARRPVEDAPTFWASHRGAVRRRVGTELREQPGWWLDLEGPFLIDPISLAELRARGTEILAAIASSPTEDGPAYAPFYGYGDTYELRPTQYYLTKLPSAVAALLPGPDLPQLLRENGASRVGAPWREPWVSETEDRSRQVEVDVEVVERGLRGHVNTERALATALRAISIEPQSPTTGYPNFDIAWEHEGTVYVAEIKSTTDRNEERQLRLGLGQVLRYRSLLAELLKRPVRAVLVPERSPRDPSWKHTCIQLDVVLLPGDQLPDALAAKLGFQPNDTR